MRDRPSPEEPITGTIVIVDVSSFGLKQAWSVRNYAQNISKILATCYPEVLDTIYVRISNFRLSSNAETSVLIHV